MGKGFEAWEADSRPNQISVGLPPSPRVDFTSPANYVRIAYYNNAFNFFFIFQNCKNLYNIVWFLQYYSGSNLMRKRVAIMRAIMHVVQT